MLAGQPQSHWIALRLGIWQHWQHWQSYKMHKDGQRWTESCWLVRSHYELLAEICPLQLWSSWSSRAEWSCRTSKHGLCRYVQILVEKEGCGQAWESHKLHLHQSRFRRNRTGRQIFLQIPMNLTRLRKIYIYIYYIYIYIYIYNDRQESSKWTCTRVVWLQLCSIPQAFLKFSRSLRGKPWTKSTALGWMCH